MERNIWLEVIITLHVLGKNPCSEPEKRWLENIQTDISCPGLSVTYTGYLNEWTIMIKSSEQKFVSNPWHRRVQLH